MQILFFTLKHSYRNEWQHFNPYFQFIRSAKVFEEEDFDPRDYGYVLTPDVVNTKACFMLKEAEDELMKQLKANMDLDTVHFNIIFPVLFS